MVIARWSALIFNSILIEKLNVSITLYSLGLITFDLYWIHRILCKAAAAALLLLLLLMLATTVKEQITFWLLFYLELLSLCSCFSPHCSPHSTCPPLPIAPPLLRANLMEHMPLPLSALNHDLLYTEMCWEVEFSRHHKFMLQLFILLCQWQEQLSGSRSFVAASLCTQSNRQAHTQDISPHFSPLVQTLVQRTLYSESYFSIDRVVEIWIVLA